MSRHSDGVSESAVAESSARRTPSRRPKRLLSCLAVGIALLLGLRFTVRRWSEAAHLPHLTDFNDFFLPAGEHIADGSSPYRVAGYVHPPLTALVTAVISQLHQHQILVWTTLSAAAAFVAPVVLTLAMGRGPSGVKYAVLLAGAFVTLLASRPTMRVFFLGQTDFFILLWLGIGLWCVTAHRSGGAGFAIGMAAAIKAWPVIFVLTAVRAGGSRRRFLLGAAIPIVLCAAAAILIDGARGLVDMVTRPISNANQDLTSYSTFGAGKALFSDESQVQPITHSPVLQWALTAGLTAFVLALLAITLVRQTDPVVQYLTTIALCLLLIPVSQFPYLIFALPLVWAYGRDVLRHPRDLWAWACLLLGLAFWYFCFFRVPSAVGGLITSEAFILQFGSELVLVAGSALLPILRARLSKS